MDICKSLRCKRMWCYSFLFLLFHLQAAYRNGVTYNEYLLSLCLRLCVSVRVIVTPTVTICFNTKSSRFYKHGNTLTSCQYCYLLSIFNSLSSACCSYLPSFPLLLSVWCYKQDNKPLPVNVITCSLSFIQVSSGCC